MQSAMNLLTLNCQRGYQPGLAAFLKNTLENGLYDVLMLQEVTDQVLSYLNHPAYQHIRVFSKEFGREIELCIVYRKTFRLLRQGFKSFAKLPKDSAPRENPCFGIVWADLEINANAMRVASIHAHAGISSTVRLEEVRLAKEALSKETVMPTIIGGDFNSAFPSEPAKMAGILAPEFHWATENLGPTLNSRYTENGPRLPNMLARLFAFFKLGISLRTDHFFMSGDMAEKYTAVCRILPNRVSDHSAVECVLYPILPNKA